MSELLRIKDLWGGYKEGVDILRGIDMTVAEGEAVGIIGLNGSGKSTLGKAIMNMLPFRSGELCFDGKDVSGLSTHELARKGISIMPQGGKVFQNLSVWENLEIAFSEDMDGIIRLQGIIPILQEPRKALKSLMADRLSGGQKHQLALAMTLANSPRLVILDEPSAGLSPKAVEEMYELLRDVRERLKMTMLLIEQNIAKAVNFSDKCFLVRQGVVSVITVSDFEIIKSTIF